MALIIILNAALSAFVLVGIVGIHLWAIAKSRSEQIASEPVAAAPAASRARAERRRPARSAIAAAR